MPLQVGSIISYILVIVERWVIHRLHSNSTEYEQFLAKKFQEKINFLTGYELEIISTTDSTKKFVFAKVEAEDPYSYSIVSDESVVNINYSNAISMHRAIAALLELCEAVNSEPINMVASVRNESNVNKEDNALVRVMSSNVLNCLDNASIGSELSYQSRMAILAEYYVLYQPDFIGLQECTPEQYPLLAAGLGENYGKLIFEEHDPVSINHMFYRTDKYIIEDSGYMPLSTSQTKRFEWALFKEIGTDFRLIVMNFHANYRGSDYRVPEAADINAVIDGIVAEYPNIPIYFTGDYNAAASSEEFATMIEGLNMQSGMLVAEKTDGDLGTYHTIGDTTVTSNFAIDHITVTYELTDVKLYRRLADELLAYASDHYPIFIDSYKTEVKSQNVEAPEFKVTGYFGGRNVTMTSTTDDAVIYYKEGSSDISLDDNMVENGGTVSFRDFNGTIYAKSYKDGVWSSVSKFVLNVPVVDTPTIEVNGETVTIMSNTPNSYICYTSDGTVPSWENGKRIANSGGTVTISAGKVVRAIAVRSGFANSSEAKTYIPIQPVAFTVKGIFGGRNVTMKSATDDVEIYYSTTTGSITTSDKKLKNGESIDFSNFYGTVYARAYKNGKWSNVARLILKIPQVNKPVITQNGTVVTIKTTTPSCYIYYTKDGTTPSITNGIKVNGSKAVITAKYGETIKAIAVRSCFSNSEIVSRDIIER